MVTKPVVARRRRRDAVAGEYARRGWWMVTGRALQKTGPSLRARSARFAQDDKAPALYEEKNERVRMPAMSLRFVVTDHAFDRFVERAELDNPESAEYRELLLAELERGVPFGGQVGHDALYLLPCGLVAAIAWDNGRGFLKTVLTREQAIANMEAQGAILRPVRPFRHEVRETRAASSAELHALAERHFNDGVSRKERNASLRERGYDPAAEAGEIYRAAYRALVDAKWARKREKYWRLHQR